MVLHSVTQIRLNWKIILHSTHSGTCNVFLHPQNMQILSLRNKVSILFPLINPVPHRDANQIIDPLLHKFTKCLIDIYPMKNHHFCQKFYL